MVQSGLPQTVITPTNRQQESRRIAPTASQIEERASDQA